MNITRSKGGTEEREVPLEEVQVPDLWSAVVELREVGNTELADQVEEIWALAGDLLRTLKEIEELRAEGALPGEESQTDSPGPASSQHHPDP